jgi:endoglucanase
MRFVALLAGAATLAAVVASPTTGTATVKKRKSSFLFTGVNESGAEFGNTAIPGQLGKDYIWPVHSAIDVGTFH